MAYVKSDEFIEICYEHDFNVPDIVTALTTLNPSSKVTSSQVAQRIANYRRKGKLPLDSGNSVSHGEWLKGSSTLYDENGVIKLQWIKSDVPREQFLESYLKAISALTLNVPSLPKVSLPLKELNSECATLYISNDVHLGALMWDKESGEDWNIDLAKKTLYAAYDHLFECSPDSEVGIVCDLGDLLEADNDKNMTPKSGNVLAVDSRYPKVLQVAYEALIYAVNKALIKHKTVYFYNIFGNHDLNTGHAIREIIRMAFKDNPRVVVDPSPSPIKYHQHGTVLLQFAHGDGMKMKDAGEVMAVECQDIFSSTVHRFSHSGHTHKDAVVEGRLCRSESHRNIAPLNAWAHHKGYRRQPGTMKSITYHKDNGEVSRNTFNLS